MDNFDDFDDNFDDGFEGEFDYDEEIEENDIYEEEDEEEIIDDNEISQFKEKKIESINKNKSRNIIIVPNDQKITDNRLHKNELSFVLSTRSKQIAKYGTYFATNINSKDPIEIAYKELYEKKCPLKLRRQVGINNSGDLIVEEWDLKTMVLPNINLF